MGYIVGAYEKNSVVTFPVALINIASGETSTTELSDLEAGDFQCSINGGAFANVSAYSHTPAGSGQIFITLDATQTPGAWTTVRFIDQTATKVHHDNWWSLNFGNVASTSGSVITVNPSAFVDAEAIANLVGPYLANYLVTTLTMPTEAEWDAIIAQAADITAIKAKTDLLAFTAARVNANVGAIETPMQALIKTLVYQSIIDPANTLAQLSVGPLPTTPTVGQALSGLLMALRNGGINTATSGTTGTRTIRNAAGTIISTANMTKSSTVTDTGFLDS